SGVIIRLLGVQVPPQLSAPQVRKPLRRFGFPTSSTCVAAQRGVPRAAGTVPVLPLLKPPGSLPLTGFGSTGRPGTTSGRLIGPPALVPGPSVFPWHHQHRDVRTPHDLVSDAADEE